MRLGPGLVQVGGWTPGAAGASVAALIDYLIVGGGRAAWSGGEILGSYIDPFSGGGGDVAYSTAKTLAVGSYAVVVGAGGVSGESPGASSFNGITANGSESDAGANGANAGNYDITGASLGYGTGASATGANRGRGAATDSSGTATFIAGENGCVIIRYLTGTMTATGGTITTSGGYTIHTFTSNGTWQRTG